ncbi:MAG: HlyD family efflux transporter periplasmic adaptor subunit [Magnetococcales bacterium]|nr:HlyD family efflux transporter periplasmic adaptor subunit [Magnetococcales bacterium]
MSVIYLLPLLLLLGCREQPTHTVHGYVEGEYVRIGLPSGGRVTEIRVAKGARVEAGAVLFALEDDLERLGVAEATANLERTRALRDNLLTGKKTSEITVLEHQRSQAEANLRLSSLRKARQESLIRSDATSRDRLDEFVSARQRDAARVEELEATIQVARERGREAEIQAAEAALKSAEAGLRRAEWLLTQRVGVAGVAGLVEEVLFRPGETVAAQQPVVTVLPPGQVTIRFFLGAEAIGRLSPGAKLSLVCAGCPPDLTAHVSHIAAEAVYAPPVLYSREGKEKLVFAVEALPDAHAARLHPGQPVIIHLSPDARTPS